MANDTDSVHREPDRYYALKSGDTFAVFDAAGDMPEDAAALGLFREDTRILSRWLLTLDGRSPSVLGSAVSRDRAVFRTDLSDPGGTLHLLRTKVLHGGACHERLTLTSYADVPTQLILTIRFGADFRDIFEVRGTTRERRGAERLAQIDTQSIVLSYQGLDGRTRAVRIAFSEPPGSLDHERAVFHIEVPARQRVELLTRVGEPQEDDRPPDIRRFRHAMAVTKCGIHRYLRGMAPVKSDNQLFDEWIREARADLTVLITELETGPYPYAGIPWFSTPFGRDAIVTALELLWLEPGLARGVLGFLAARQATEVSAFNDSEPGKILHELRKGEMSHTGEVPFLAYFGGVDTTPLFVVLAAGYFERTGDTDLMRELWPSIEAALGWVDRYGDRDGDGFVEYQAAAGTGLVNQGWKDSHDSVSHADGSLARGPIALCEVQGYVYAARIGAARIASVLGHRERAASLRRQAGDLRRRVERQFWSERLGTYVLALDGDKRPCEVLASNAGHLLLCGLPSASRAQRLADVLFDRRFFTGWGIRTLAEGEARYNPMSYHNGSVWPHDNALIAAGLGRYGFRDHANRLLAGLFDAAIHLPQARLPELFCGFPRRPGQGPTAYPVACLPQAWSSGAVFMLLQGSLGIRVDGRRNRIRLERPQLPNVLGRLDIKALSAGDGRVTLRLIRHGSDTEVTTAHRHGQGPDVLISK